MHNLFKLFGISAISFGALFCCFSAESAESLGRAAYNVTQSNRTGALTAAGQRMPTMPTLSINTVGNMSPDLPTTPSNPGGGDGGDDDNPDNPDNPDEPTCPDGGVENSDYTVEMCMNDILTCINNGALSGGLNDLFNEDLRNAIVNGMGLCSAQVERCVDEVRKDCDYVYSGSADVWIDFNARIIQPEYYNFVLRKTGLTPNQAENTCLLLDRNTYGSSFNAVSNTGAVTSEYNQTVGAYNNQNGNVLVKNQPQGVNVNQGNLGVDGQRGHYARWDATTAECLIRVAAYNKDDQITNSWLFGAAGNDQPAEVWKAAGDTFTCNRDLFGFSLMNQTNTAAVVGVGGGALLGAGVGALAGHGDRAFDCNNKNQLKKLSEDLNKSGNIAIINEYMTNQIPMNGGDLTVAQCQELVELYNVYNQIITALEKCPDTNPNVSVSSSYLSEEYTISCDGYDILDDCFAANDETKACVGKGFEYPQDCADFLSSYESDTSVTSSYDNNCLFKPINNAKITGNSIYCIEQGGTCIGAKDMRQEINRMKTVFDNLTILGGEDSNMGKAIGIGVGVGAGAGGLATAITAFVESSNINCRVGDGLDKVGYGKAYSIGSLKDFYVKWNLRLPDTVAPTVTVTDCDSWKKACATLTDLNQCKAAQINYKPADAKTVTLVKSACTISGSDCIENYPVAKSYGACE